MESSARADLGCPIVGVVEPGRELRQVLEDVEAIARLPPTTTEV